MIAALALLVATVPPTIPIPAGYMPIADDMRRIEIAVPETWTDVQTVPLMDTEGTDDIPHIVASPDIVKFYSSFSVPGAQFFALPQTDDLISVVDTYGLTSGCKEAGLFNYDDPDFFGVVQVATGCGPLDMTWNMVVANPVVQPEIPVTVVVQVQSVDEVERRTVLLTFNMT